MSARPASITKPVTITSQAEVAFTLAALAGLTNQLNTHLTTRDKAVLEAQKTCSKEIEETTAAIQQQEARLQEWAEKNRATEFTEAKSLEFPRGVIGFRTGQRSLEPIKGFTWQKVLAALKGKWRKYRRVKAEVNKRELLTDSAPDAKGKVKLSAAQLKALGLVVVQEESFFVELSGETPGLTTKA
ncbi:MAG TPA: host-nuclease inhibitor Gam family protein [Candidatus Saccharimonadales bacterium]|nr:host-nuclease inhibitor Gam family protein [Candidatus Saccharimonadales bacterium]